MPSDQSTAEAAASDELAGDDSALDFVGALADDHEGAVAEVAFGVKFGGVAIAAVYAEPR